MEKIKHTCKDCIHFKVCNDYVYLIGREDKVACPDYKSTEDVVPRSEFEEMQKFKDMAYAELKSYNEELKAKLDQAKQEVAREIIQILEDFYRSDSGTIVSDDKYEELVHNVGVENAKNKLFEIIEEIEKKYIGE